ncbi:MAG: polysaccharide biosynthesis PFTS motif protein [Betaproteobacteria bacterium]|nr:polysaccharide biosynthesis PFTS motif protein [Betaproteobacteria bacterium]
MIDLPIWKALVARRKRQRLRGLIRGYALLKREGRIADLRALRNGLVDVAVASHASASTRFFGAGAEHLERMLRQFVLERYAGPALNRAIIYAKAKRGASVAHPMPRAWRRYLASSGVAVDHFRSAIAWAVVVLMRYLHGIVTLVRLLRSNLNNNSNAWAEIQGHYVYFDGLTAANIPQVGSSTASYDICSWYIRWPDRSHLITAVCHGVSEAGAVVVDGVTVKYERPPYEQLSGGHAIVRLALWGVWAVLAAGVGMLLGRWQKALLLAEAAKSRAVQLTTPDRLAVDYWFHYSGNVFRPMWTYEAERHGAAVTMYFYSTCDQIKLKSGYASQRFEWGPACWPRYVVWDTFQAAMLRRDLGPDPEMIISGPIHYSDAPLAVPPVSGTGFAVFDVQTNRRSAHFGISTLADFWAAYPDVHMRFLRDVRDVLAKCGGAMVLKGKRDIGSRGEKRYSALMQEFAASDGVILVNSGISAVRVIQCCCAGISIPFTSTALYVREQGLPSVYYDPTGWIQKDDLGAHGIPILSGKEELRAWVAAVLDTSGVPDAGDKGRAIVSGN